MDRKVIDRAMEGIDRKYISEALHLSRESAACTGKEIESMKRRPIRFAKSALIAACACLALAVSVAAAGFILYDKADGMLAAFFGEDEYSSYDAYTISDSGIWEGESIEGWYTKGEPFLKQWEKPAWNALPISDEMKETLSQYVYEVDRAVSLEGCTLTVEACMYSQATDIGMLYYTLENPDGVGNYEVSPKGEVLWTDPNGVLVNDGVSFCRIDSANTTDTKLGVCCFFIIAEPRFTNQTPNEWAEMRPCLYIRHGEETSDSILIDPYDLGVPTVSAAEGGMQVSPFGMLLYDEELGPDSGSGINGLKIVFKDGSEYIIHGEGTDECYLSLRCGGNVKKAYISLVFNRVIDPNEVEKVILEGVEYPVG